MSELTIILLLKNRKEFNNRFIDFFLENKSNYNLIISDGSRKKIQPDILKKIKNNKSIEYVKFIEDKSYNTFYKKIFKTLKLVKTKYVLFAANDDFLIFDTIKLCLKFLKKNKSYIGAGGRMIGFEMSKKNKKDFKIKNTYCLYSNIKLDQKNQVDRFNYFLKNFCDLPKNSIIEKKILLKNYELASNNFDNHIEIMDHFSALYNVLSGRIKIFKKALIFHQDHLKSEGNMRWKAIKPFFTSKNFFDYLIKFDNLLSTKIKLKKFEIIKKYYKNLLSPQLDILIFPKEPSIVQIKNMLIKKVFRKKKLYKKEKNNRSNFMNLNKEIKFINQFLLNNKN